MKLHRETSMRKGLFGFDEGPVFEGYTDGTKWNGWINVWLDETEYQRLREWVKSIGEWLDVIPKDTFATNGFVEFELYRFADGWSWNEMESKERRSMEADANYRLTFMGKKVPAGINLWITNANGEEIFHNIERARTDYSDWQCQIVDESYPVSYRTVQADWESGPASIAAEILESLGEDPESDLYAEGFRQIADILDEFIAPEEDDEEDES